MSTSSSIRTSFFRNRVHLCSRTYFQNAPFFREIGNDHAYTLVCKSDATGKSLQWLWMLKAAWGWVFWCDPSEVVTGFNWAYSHKNGFGNENLIQSWNCTDCRPILHYMLFGTWLSGTQGPSMWPKSPHTSK